MLLLFLLVAIAITAEAFAQSGPCSNAPGATTANSTGYCVCVMAPGDTFINAQNNRSKLEACFNVTWTSGTVALPANTAAYVQPTLLNKKLILQTEGRSTNCSALDSSCATLLASAPNCQQPANAATHLFRLDNGAAGATVRYLRFSGNKFCRPLNLPNRLPLVTLFANNVTFKGNAVYDNIAGQALVVGTEWDGVVNDAWITFNDIRDNGWRPQPPPQIDTVSDGLAVKDGAGHHIEDNFFRNNTDVDLIFGGCTSCSVVRNTIHHSGYKEGRANTAIMLQQWAPVNGVGFWTSGRFDGSAITNNGIDCQVEGGGQGCGVGIELGCLRWNPGTPCTPFMAGGYVAQNSVWDAAIGILANHAESAMVHHNGVYNSGGQTPPYTNLCGGPSTMLPACAYSAYSASHGLNLFGGNCMWTQRNDLVQNCQIAGANPF